MSETDNSEGMARLCRRIDYELALNLVRTAASQSTDCSFHLLHAQGKISQAEAAKQCGITEDAFKQSYQRFKEKFNRYLRVEVAKLVGPDKVEIRTELSYLMSLSIGNPP